MPVPNQRRTLVMGEALVDVVTTATGETTTHVGGSPLNVAVGLARLEHPAVLATHIAADDHGRLIAEMMSREGVELTPASTDLARTSTARAQLDESGAATYEFDVDWPELVGLPTDVGHVHTGSIGSWYSPGCTSVERALAEAREYATTSYDPNVRPALMGDAIVERERVERLLAHVDVVKCSDEDASWLYPDRDEKDVVRRWAGLGPRLVVVTRGAHGCFAALSKGDGEIEMAGRRVPVIDTVGAGDSFMSGLISGLLDARLLGGAESRRRMLLATLDDIQPALERATRTSSLTVTRAGSQPPTRQELRSHTSP